MFDLNEWWVGVQLTLSVIWVLVVIRLFAYSWQYTKFPKTRRDAGWIWFRIGLIFVALSIVFAYNPANFLMGWGLIPHETFVLFLISHSALECVAGACFLTALDVGVHGKHKAAIPYFALILFAPLWVAWV